MGRKEEMGINPEIKKPDLASYVRLHKEILIPKEGLDKVAEEFNVKNPGYSVNNFKPSYCNTDGLKFNSEGYIYFVDSEGNLAGVLIKATEINGLENETDLQPIINDKLEEMGFTYMNNGIFHRETLIGIMLNHNNQINNQESQKKHEGFDF